MKVLVTAASKHGATAEIAWAIGEVLSERGLETRVMPPDDVGTIAGYDAVVLGSATYAGHWLDPAKAFVTRFRDSLITRPVWLFSSGPVGDPSRKLVRRMGADPLEVAGILAVTNARGHRVFAGKLDRKYLSRGQRTALALFRGLEGDFRDWDDIRGWAAAIADELGAGRRARGEGGDVPLAGPSTGRTVPV